MKTVNFFKSLIPVVALSVVFIFSSCDKDDDDNSDTATYTIAGDATGAQEVPAVTTTGTATLTGTFNARTNILTYSITWTNLSGNVTDAHIHGPAAAGTNASVLQSLTITTNGAAGVAAGTLALSDAEEDALLAGNVYYNLHTAANTNGEIRGQITSLVTN